jgi:hypothetical protein
MSQIAIKQAEQEAKDTLGIERGKGKRVPADRLDEFNDKVQEILKVSLLPSDVKTAVVRSLSCFYFFIQSKGYITPKNKREREDAEGEKVMD